MDSFKSTEFRINIMFYFEDESRRSDVMAISRYYGDIIEEEFGNNSTFYPILIEKANYNVAIKTFGWSESDYSHLLKAVSNKLKDISKELPNFVKFRVISMYHDITSTYVDIYEEVKDND